MSMLIEAVAKTADELFALFSKEIKVLKEDEFKSLLRKFKHSSHLIDVSSKDDFFKLHIPGSTNFDVRSPKFASKIGMLDRSKAYFLYCRDGSQSESAMRIMKQMGFKRVYSLIAGIDGWRGTVATSNAPW